MDKITKKPKNLKKTGIKVHIAKWNNEQQKNQIKIIRSICFNKDIYKTNEFDDKTSIHVVAINSDQEIIASGKINNSSEIKCICVLPKYRKQKIGKLLVRALIDIASLHLMNHNIVKVTSTIQLVSFFENCGFKEKEKQDDFVKLTYLLSRNSPMGLSL